MLRGGDAGGVTVVDASAHAVFVFEVLIALGPLAVYFLGLGLVNSQPRPCLVNARVDFVWLTVAFVPVIAVPSVAMVQQGLLVVALSVVLGVALLFLWEPAHRSLSRVCRRRRTAQSQRDVHYRFF